MFYCDVCADINDWPQSLAKSSGNCELCGEKEICNDVKSSLLPPPKSKEISMEHISAYLPYAVKMYANLILKEAGKLDKISEEYTVSELIGIEQIVVGHNPHKYTGEHKIHLRDEDGIYWKGEYLDGYKLVLKPLSCLNDTIIVNGDEATYMDLIDDSDQTILSLADPYSYNDIENVSARCWRFLLQHHFDVFNLIENRHAISIKDLD